MPDCSEFMSIRPETSCVGNRFAEALLFCLILAIYSLNAGITDPGNGNPLIPGFFADPFVFYDNNTFYLYATTDGYDDNSFKYFGPFGVWYSPDFLNWSFKNPIY